MTNTKYMLDTSAVRDLIYGQNPTIRKRLLEVPMANICISAITEAELWRSALQHPQAEKLSAIIQEFLLRVKILPWDSKAATAYAQLVAADQKKELALSCMDLLIAAHSKSEGTVLVTNNTALNTVQDLLPSSYSDQFSC